INYLFFLSILLIFFTYLICRTYKLMIAYPIKHVTMKTNSLLLALGIFLTFTGFNLQEIQISGSQFQLPVLKNKSNNPVLRIKISNAEAGQILKSLSVSAWGVSDLADIKAARLYYYGTDSLPGNMETTKAKLVASAGNIQQQLEFETAQPLQAGDNYFWL